MSFVASSMLVKRVINRPAIMIRWNYFRTATCTMISRL
jgi:hypothetical protein